MRLSNQWPFLFLACLLFTIDSLAVSEPIQVVRIGPVDPSRADVTLILSPNTIKKCAGHFRGQLMVYDVTPALPVAGVLGFTQGACELRAPIPWHSVTEKMAQQARGDALKLRFAGELIDGKSVRKVNWVVVASKSNLILTEPMKVTLKRFAKAHDLQISSIGLRDSTVNADITVQSPLSFDLRVQRVTCSLDIQGVEVATGAKESFVLLPNGRPTTLRVPISIHHKALLSAAGSVLSQMGKVNAKLTGLIRVRFPNGDIDFPIEFSVQLNLV